MLFDIWLYVYNNAKQNDANVLVLVLPTEVLVLVSVLLPEVLVLVSVLPTDVLVLVSVLLTEVLVLVSVLWKKVLVTSLLYGAKQRPTLSELLHVRALNCNQLQSTCVRL